MQHDEILLSDLPHLLSRHIRLHRRGHGGHFALRDRHQLLVFRLPRQVGRPAGGGGDCATAAGRIPPGGGVWRRASRCVPMRVGCCTGLGLRDVLGAAGGTCWTAYSCREADQRAGLGLGLGM